MSGECVTGASGDAYRCETRARRVLGEAGVSAVLGIDTKECLVVLRTAPRDAWPGCQCQLAGWAVFPQQVQRSGRSLMLARNVLRNCGNGGEPIEVVACEQRCVRRAIDIRQAAQMAVVGRLARIDEVIGKRDTQPDMFVTIKKSAEPERHVCVWHRSKKEAAVAHAYEWRGLKAGCTRTWVTGCFEHAKTERIPPTVVLDHSAGRRYGSGRRSGLRECRRRKKRGGQNSQTSRINGPLPEVHVILLVLH